MHFIHHASRHMGFQIQAADGDVEPLELRHPALIMAGYTGRNKATVLAHIKELAEYGIPAPASVPAYYAIPWQLLSFPDEPVEVGNAETSGEIEPVLIITDRGTYVTVGSDHTDRAAEQTSIVHSKRLAPKIIARTAWPLDEVAAHWDQLALRSWADDSTPYQEGTAQRIMPLADFPLSSLRPAGRDLVLFLGTIPLLDGEFVMARHFRGELLDPLRERVIELSYDVHLLSQGEGVYAER